MTLPSEPVYLVVATIPIVFLLVALMGFGWSVAKAAPVGMILAGCIAVVVFGSQPSALLLETGKGIWNAATILLVIWPAVFSYELACETKGFEAIRSGIQSLTRHKLLQILIFGWIFPSFLQGITGFGVAVAVGAPLLLSIGVAPLYSIVIVLICHCWGATFGTLALAWDALIAQAGMTSEQNARAAVIAAAMIWIFNLICVLLSCWMYGGAKALKEGGLAVALLSAILGGGELALAPVNSTVACFLPSAVALGAAVLLSRTKKYRREWAIKDSRIMVRRDETAHEQQTMGFHQAFLPYYVLTAITAVCLLIPPVNRALGKWKLGLSFPQTATGYGFVTPAESCFSPMSPLTYAGTFLVATCVISFLYYRRKGFAQCSSLATVWKRTVKKCAPSTVAIISLIVMSKYMSSSGMIYVLSNGIVSLLGRVYVIVAPFFGMLGAFITSSNMSSNILLGNFQTTAARILGIDPAVTAALQTVGGVLGDAFAPGSVIMGVSTTGFSGKDGSILKKIIPLAAGCGAAFGAFAYLFLL